MAATPRVELAGATALVTGAGSGIGRSTTIALAAAGAHVHVTDVRVDRAERVAAELAAAGHAADHHHLDVTDADATAHLAAALDPVDVVVANAGVGMTGRFADMTIDDWRWIRSVNLDGAVHTAHAFGPPMLERGHGHLVLVSSGLGYTPRATESAYCTTKAAVLELAQCLRADWRAHGVGVSAVCPGVIDTPILDGTRFLGDTTDEAATRRAFARGHAPDTVARDVLRAVREDRGLVASGWEAKAGWALHRLAPLRLQQRIATREL